MWSYLLPVLFALLVWWAATVIMMRRSLSAPPKCLLSLLSISLVAVVGTLALLATLDQATVTGAYVGFLGGMSLWAWHELSYFLGIVSGPRPEPCTPGASSARRFAQGVRASLWHELGIIITAALLWWISHESANQMGLWTFVLLWVMRWSAKLNIFLGVRNLHEQFWPDHLRYLVTYVGKPGGNWLFPISMLAAGAGLFVLIGQAFLLSTSLYQQTANLLLATMLVLAALEHIFLVLKVNDEWLWRLATRASAKDASIVNVKWQARPGS